MQYFEEKYNTIQEVQYDTNGTIRYKRLNAIKIQYDTKGTIDTSTI
jgi:hypothetical protein